MVELAMVVFLYGLRGRCRTRCRHLRGAELPLTVESVTVRVPCPGSADAAAGLGRIVAYGGSGYCQGATLDVQDAATLVRIPVSWRR